MGADWFGRASCTAMGHDAFFPTCKGRQRAKVVAALRATCAACPVRVECVTVALAYDTAGCVQGGFFFSPYDHARERDESRHAAAWLDGRLMAELDCQPLPAGMSAYLTDCKVAERACRYPANGYDNATDDEDESGSGRADESLRALAYVGDICA